ncbi:hypothetical protein AB0G04_04135 [Actinoplanes sp. NPDC023801]|uniref:hypothetical protein n=1 Tax=Actinoplanes sp. NPDC023801 TaxID=3154595 RepID=UPI0033E827EB
MPSQVHEVLIDMFRGRPSLAAELLDGPLQGALPDYDEAHLASADLTDVAPTEYRADAVVTLTRGEKKVLSVVVEVQRQIDPRKLRSWPAYVATLYARLGCPVTLLVLCPQQPVADWAAKPILISLPPSRIFPVAFGPAQTPLITDPETAQRLPELTILSTLAHADQNDPIPLFKALFRALDAIEADRAALYHDFVLTVLPAATRKLLEDYMTTTDHPYKSEWAQRQYAAGEAHSIIKVLKARGIDVSDEAQAKITACIDRAQLDQWLERATVAERVEDLGGALAE